MLLLLALACTAEPAPERIEDLVVYGFVNFDDPTRVDALVEPLSAWVDANGEGLEDGYGVASLTEADLRAAGVHDAEVDGILGALGVATYAVDVDDVAAAITSPERADIYAATTVFDVLDEEGDRACFLARTCPRYAFRAHEVTSVPLLGDSERELYTELAWVDAHPGVLAVRQLVPEPTVFAVPLLAVDQQYGFFVLEPGPQGGTRRAEAFWVDAKVIGLEVPEGYAVDQAVGRMQSSAAEIDAWYLGGDQ